MPVISFLPAVFMTVVQPRAFLKVKDFFKIKTVKNMFLLGFFYAVQGISYFLAIEKGAHASQIAPINRASIIVTVLLAAIFLKERDHLLKKFFSAILVTLGVLFLI